MKLDEYTVHYKVKKSKGAFRIKAKNFKDAENKFLKKNVVENVKVVEIHVECV